MLAFTWPCSAEICRYRKGKSPASCFKLGQTDARPIGLLTARGCPAPEVSYRTEWVSLEAVCACVFIRACIHSLFSSFLGMKRCLSFSPGLQGSHRLRLMLTSWIIGVFIWNKRQYFRKEFRWDYKNKKSPKTANLPYENHANEDEWKQKERNVSNEHYIEQTNLYYFIQVIF